jgi:peroxiredoxin Q/BCP
LPGKKLHSIPEISFPGFFPSHIHLILRLPLLFAFKIGEKVKPFELRDIDGNYTRLVDYCGEKPKAKVIILDFFSTECNSCIKALDVLKKIKKEYEGIEVFLISFQEKERSLRKFFEGKEFPFIILMDKFGDEARNYGVWGLPFYVFLDSGCVWRDKIEGEVQDYEKVLRDKVEKIMKK